MTTRSAYPQWNEQEAQAYLEAVVREHDGPVLLCLQALQEVYGHVPPPAVALVATLCNVSRADVTGVLSFYADLRTEPPPAIPVRLCAAEACQAVGGRALAAAWQQTCRDDQQLAQDTGVDEPIFCLGNCALGPAALVDGQLVGRATVATLRARVMRAREATGASEVAGVSDGGAK